MISFVGSAFAADSSSVRSTIAHLMESDRRQHRRDLTADPILMSVATKRAQDMANRGYFNHVNPEGIGPNYLLGKAGYPLPACWLHSKSSNYVESICAGYSTPELAWAGFMRSAPHKKHLLGLSSFYAGQTRYGIGFAYNPAAPLKYYYVVITAPPPGAETTQRVAYSGSVRWMQW